MVPSPISTEILPHLLSAHQLCSQPPLSPHISPTFLFSVLEPYVLPFWRHYDCHHNWFISFIFFIVRFLYHTNPKNFQQIPPLNCTSGFLSFRLRSNATQSSYLHISLLYSSHPTLQFHCSCPSRHKTFPHPTSCYCSYYLNQLDATAGCLLVFRLHLLSSHRAVI